MKVKDSVERKLTDEFHPERLVVTDQSHLHKGHSGWREGGETHFLVEIVSAKFTGVGRLQRHRMVNEALKAELTDGIHALAIQARTPDESNRV